MANQVTGALWTSSIFLDVKLINFP